MATPSAPPVAPPPTEGPTQPPLYPSAFAPAPAAPTVTPGAPEPYSMPPVPQADEAPESRRIGCCGRFFGGHSTEEAGLSFWIHPYLLATTRFLSSAFLIFIAVGLFVYNPIIAGTYLPVWVSVLEATSFLLLGVCTVVAALGKSAGPLARVAVPLHQTAVTGAILVFPRVAFDAAYRWLPVYALVFIPQVALFLIDSLILASRMRFRFAYILFAAAFLIAYYIVLFSVSAGLGTFRSFHVGYFVLSFVECAAAGVVATAITRLTGCIAARCKSRGGAEEVNAQGATNV